MNKAKYFALFSEDAKIINDIVTEPSDRLAIFDQILAYMTGQTPADISGVAAFAWASIKQKQEHGEEVRAARAVAGAKGGQAGVGVSRNVGNQHAASAEANKSKSIANQKQNEANNSNQKQINSLLYSTLQDSTLQNNTIQNNTSNTPSIPHGGKVCEKTDYDSLFDTFWKSYPRKVAKSNAQKAYAKALKSAKDPGALAQTILTALDTHKKLDQWLRDDGKYIPHAATWLNQQRWADEVSPAPTTSPSPATSMTTATHQGLPMTLRERCEDAIWAKLVEVTPDIDRSAWAHYVTEQSSRFVMRIDEALAAQPIHNKEAFVTAMVARDAKYHADKAGEDKHNDALMRDDEWAECE